MWVLAVSMLLLCSCTKQDKPLQAGDLAPDFRAEDLTGKRVYLNAETKQSAVLVTFFATWCDPCRAELPLLAELQRKLSGRLKVLLVAIDPENVDELHTLYKAFSLPFPLVLDSGEHIKRAYGVEQLPASFLVDRRGTIRSVLQAIGEGEAKMLEQTIRTLSEAR